MKEEVEGRTIAKEGREPKTLAGEPSPEGLKDCGFGEESHTRIMREIRRS